VYLFFDRLARRFSRTPELIGVDREPIGSLH